VQRLALGLGVNGAKDDAACGVIQVRMSCDVRVSARPIRNSNHGVSLAQTAEGGLTSLSDMFQRMRELSVQATNATNTSGDIAALNQEYTQLNAEVTRTLGAVQFNGTNLFTATANFDFQVGANSGQTISIVGSAIGVSTNASITVVTTGAGATLVTSAAADNAANIARLDAALLTINSTRATLGAVQSRFDSTMNFLKTAQENQAAARGRIMDADFASETSNLSRAQILQQAGTAMIAQANQLPQGVLALLR